MKIVLVRYHDRGNINTRLPDSLNKRQGHLPPLGIAYIASFLKLKGFDVKILDAIALNMTKKAVEDYFAKEKPDVTGISCMTTNFKGALECAGIAKMSASITVMGGPQIAIYPNEMMSYKDVDYCIAGEAEYSFLKLAEFLSSSNKDLNEDISSIPGLVYRDAVSGAVQINSPEIIEDIDSIPIPARELLPNDSYSSIIGLNPVTTMISTRGCPFLCGFCFKGPQDRKFRTRDPKAVVDEMAAVVKDYGVREIMFYDDVITLKRAHIVGICEEIQRRKLKVMWESPTRIDSIDRELLRLMKRSGCIRLRYGVESGDESILAKMNKKVKMEDIEKVFKLTEEEGIERFAYFIIGYAGETRETMQKTISLAKKLNPELVMFTLATPLPQTPLFNETVRKGLVDKDYWSNYTLGKRSDRIPALVPEAEKYLKKAYRSFYFRPVFIFRKLMQIRDYGMIKKYLDAFLGIMKFKMGSPE